MSLLDFAADALLRRTSPPTPPLHIARQPAHPHPDQGHYWTSQPAPPFYNGDNQPIDATTRRPTRGPPGFPPFPPSTTNSHSEFTALNAHMVLATQIQNFIRINVPTETTQKFAEFEKRLVNLDTRNKRVTEDNHQLRCYNDQLLRDNGLLLRDNEALRLELDQLKARHAEIISSKPTPPSPLLLPQFETISISNSEEVLLHEPEAVITPAEPKTHLTNNLDSPNILLHIPSEPISPLIKSNEDPSLSEPPGDLNSLVCFIPSVPLSPDGNKENKEPLAIVASPRIPSPSPILLPQPPTNTSVIDSNLTNARQLYYNQVELFQQPPSPPRQSPPRILQKRRRRRRLKPRLPRFRKRARTPLGNLQANTPSPHQPLDAQDDDDRLYSRAHQYHLPPGPMPPPPKPRIIVHHSIMIRAADNLADEVTRQSDDFELPPPAPQLWRCRPTTPRPPLNFDEVIVLSDDSPPPAQEAATPAVIPTSLQPLQPPNRPLRLPSSPRRPPAPRRQSDDYVRPTPASLQLPAPSRSHLEPTTSPYPPGRPPE